MNWKQRAGTAWEALTNPKIDKPVQKLTIGQLGAGFLDLGGMNLVSDQKASERLIKSFKGWVYANVSALAEEISKMEFELYQVGLSKGEIVYKQIESHPLLDLLDRWNPFTTNSDAMYMTEAHLELAGDTFYLLDKPKNPTTMFLLSPEKITVVPGDEQDGYNIKEYEYRPNLKNQKEVIKYPAELVIQVKNPNPETPYRGKSVVEAADITIDTDNLASEFLKQLFRNGAINSFVLGSEQRITRDDIKRMELDLKRNFTGAKNAFKTMILGGGLKPLSVQQSNKEIQILELETAMRDKLMAMFKNTKASLGIVEDVNRANAEASLEGWKQSVIKPKMSRIVDTLNEFLVPLFGNNLILTFKDPVPENRTDDVDEVQKLMGTNTRQVITVNEARDILGLDPLPDPEFDTIAAAPDQPQIQLVPPKQAVPANLKLVDYSRVLRRNKVFEQAAEMQEIYIYAKQLAKEVIEKRKKTTKEPEPAKYRSFSNDKALEYWAKQIRIAEVAEKRFQDKILAFITQLEEKTISSLHEIVPKKYKANRIKAIDPFDEDIEIAAGIDLFTPLAEEIAVLSGSEAYALLKLSTAYVPSADLRTNIAEAVKLFTTSFVETDRDKMTQILTDGLEQGMSVPQMERAIREEFGNYKKFQSERIARTETLRANNDGALDAFKQSGVVEGKQWVTADAVDECQDYDGQIVWDLDGGFYAGTDEFADGDPPLHPNCRCILIPVVADVKALDKLSQVTKELEQTKAYAAELERVALDE